MFTVSIHNRGVDGLLGGVVGAGESWAAAVARVATTVAAQVNAGLPAGGPPVTATVAGNDVLINGPAPLGVDLSGFGTGNQPPIPPASRNLAGVGVSFR